MRTALACRAVAALLLGTAIAAGGPPVPAGSVAHAQQHTLNFRNAEIQAFIDDVSIVTGYTFIVDPEVRGQVTITSQTPLTEAEVFQVFLATLRTHGYAAVRTGPGVYQILPETEGARAGAPARGERDGDVFLTSVVRLHNVSAREAIRSVGPLVSQSGAVNASDAGNLVVIVDYASNVQAIEDVLRSMDRDTSVVEMITLENIAADEMAGILDRLREGMLAGEDETRFSVSIAAVPASNSLLLRGQPDAVAEMIGLARRVDAVSRSSQTFRVVYLSHADGAQLLPILEQFAATLDPAGGTPGAGQAGTSIAFHRATNAIIINGDPDTLRELDLVIRQLDIRRPQVVIEAIIVEISDTAARDLGVQYLLAGDGDDAVPFSYSRFGGNNVDLLSLTGALTSSGGLLDEDGTADTGSAAQLRQAAIASLLGSRGGLLGVGGQTDDGTLFGLILNALETDSDSNVLSKPSVTVLDNEEASILVGQEIPITTGEALGANNTNPFRQIERQDVGVQLDVTPQINEGDTIRLTIRQEVSSIAGPVSANFQELITNQREITTTVLADDGEIIVLGGLIESDQQYRDDQVPLLGDIPVAGRLFRNESNSERRRNLMVFIRPQIIRSAEDMRQVTRQNYGSMTAAQRRATRGNGSSLEDIVDMMLDGQDPFDRPLPETGETAPNE
ncbi:type II secretion system protein GspD [Marinicauda algicola]|uniref:Type II secretion system protein GspD n=1 Tax=Marinicauda algicola TaxID=2029849 RepID=A0A4S2H4P9_9PROT|nr:type II secretion system secretin GspD [Marinicauda algicola]TGY90391.1 type II secretion system protein GspD [Marinicauda algicola]